MIDRLSRANRVNRRWVAGALLLLAGSCTRLGAAEVVELAAGAWSEPVADARGYALRGRLLVCEAHPRSDLVDIAVYVELEEVSNFIGGDVAVYCELSKTDFSGTYPFGLQCEVLNEDDQRVPQEGAAFGGAVPQSRWVVLGTDDAVRLRANPFGVRRREGEPGLPLMVDGSFWFLKADDPQTYRLTAAFAAGPQDETTVPAGAHVWQGRLELPPVELSPERR